MSSSISLLLRKRYSFWTDSPKELVERIAHNLHRTCQFDEYVALSKDTADFNAPPKTLWHVHHIKEKGPQGQEKGGD